MQSPPEIAELLAGLKRDASELKKELDRLKSAAEAAEADAIAAIQAGNDDIARECLAKQDRLTDTAADVERQIQKQEAFIATCLELMAAAGMSEETAPAATADAPDDPDGPDGPDDPEADPLLAKVAEIQRQLSRVVPPLEDKK